MKKRPKVHEFLIFPHKFNNSIIQNCFKNLYSLNIFMFMIENQIGKETYKFVDIS